MVTYTFNKRWTCFINVYKLLVWSEGDTPQEAFSNALTVLLKCDEGRR